jgi:hypothetical protein
VVKIFAWTDISEMKDNRFISSPIQAPSHELDEIEIKILLTRVADSRILLELLGLREESITTHKSRPLYPREIAPVPTQQEAG